MRDIVIDKSFLDGASTEQVRSLFVSHRALVIETLFFELITTDPCSQARCFSKLPDQPGSYSLIPNVGTFLRFELEYQAPCVPLHRHRIEGACVFNPKLRDGSYIPDGQGLQDLRTWESQVEADARDFLVRCQAIHEFFPELIGVEFREFSAVVASARRSLATDYGRVRDIYERLRAEGSVGSPGLPPALLGPEWAWFRWVQAHMLAALRIFERYQCRVPESPTPGILRRAEHSMHDVEYVLAASLAGGIATNDVEVVEDFRLLCSDGFIVRPARRAMSPV